MRCRGLHGLANPAFLSGFLFSGLPCVAPYCVRGGVRSSWITHRWFLCSAHSSLPFTFPSSRLIELPRVLLVASLVQASGPRVDHERYGRLVGVVADAVPLALGDEHGIVLLQAHRLALREGEARALEYVHDLLGVGVPV